MIYRFIISFVSLVYLPYGLAAQFSSINGRFSIPDKMACAPYGNPITINVPECDGVNLACSIDFDKGDGVANTLAITDGVPLNFQYTTPGTYVMEIQFGTTGGFDEIEITILPNEAPEFNIYTCSANRVQLEITSPQYADYNIDYQTDNISDDTSPSGMVNPFFTYPSSATQTISVKANYANCVATQKSVTPVSGPFAPSPPIINQLQVLDNNNIQLDFTTNDNFFYQLDMSTNSAGGWSNFTSINNENTFELSGLNPEANYYCYRLGTVDVCDGTAPVFNGNIICSADLQLAVQNDFMGLSWSTSNNGVTSFTLQKNPATTPITIANNVFSYNDTDLICGTSYSYQLINEYGAGIRSFSKTYSGVAVSTQKPSLIDNVATVINESTVELSWFQDPGFTPQSYFVYRVVNSAIAEAGQSSSPSFVDNNYQVDQNICYQIQYTDVCGNQSDRGKTVCPIELTGSVDRNNLVRLSWPPYNGWASGVSNYIVEKYDRSGALVESISTSTSTSHQETGGEQIYSYRVLAYPADVAVSPIPSGSNTVTLIKNPNLTHPNAFIPASAIDQNRTFRLFGDVNFIDTYELKVFNRWGELLFQSTNLEEGWDGTYNGRRMPEGTYVFIAKVIDQAGRTFDYAGTVVLLKKG